MLRAYLAIVVTIGIAASLMSHVLSSSLSQSQPQQEIHLVHPPAATVSSQGDQNVANLDGTIILQRSENGHFYAEVEVNGVPIRMLVDTGASGIALSRDDARAVGIATSIGMNDVVGEGAGGSVHGDFVTIDRITLGSKSVEQMPALVLNGGEQSLLGQSFLKQFASVEIHGDTMTLR
ncbi:MAG TPA: TIGR02281 family clan AA aspartic protease [Sphingomicrobium sp.]|nr:TIGR02281 family clan AA aspartic protease [Sphingomicrobium sp.]